MRRLIAALFLCAAILLFGAGQAWAAAPVTIPSNYVYDPSRGALHDYCSVSGDRPSLNNRQLIKGEVDFRGPCARHDLCYAGDASKKRCDDDFYQNMLQQCDYSFGSDTTGFIDYCRGRSALYYQAVRGFGGG